MKDHGIDTLVIALDGADLNSLEAQGGIGQFPALARAMRFRGDLPSAPIPQTPVAWSSFLCGTETCGIWGWHTVAAPSRLRAVGAHDLPASWMNWAQPVLLAGIPLTDDREGLWGRSIRGLSGLPGHISGSSRPIIRHGSYPRALFQWQSHTRKWCSTVADKHRGEKLVLVHCDAIDWHNHRFGNDSATAWNGWKLADELVGVMVGNFRPSRTVVISDHGSARVGRVIRIHEALFRRGLSAVCPTPTTRLEHLLNEPVCCLSDYGALWCRDESWLEPAEQTLFELGASAVRRYDSFEPSWPTLVPHFEDGCIALVPPHLYPEFGQGDVVLSADLPSVLEKHNWVGDHSHTGLVATSDSAFWAHLVGVSLHRVKDAITHNAAER